MQVYTIINSIFKSKTYILTEQGRSEAWIIDCGDIIPIIDYIETNKFLLKGVFITHSHFDHIYGLNEIVERYPNIHVYISNRGEEGLYSQKYNLSEFNETPWIYRYRNVKIVNELSEMSILNRPVKIYSTPGHDVSCLSFKIDEYFFTGDSYIPGIKTFTGWPLSNKEEALNSKEKIVGIANKGKLIIKAGH